MERPINTRIVFVLGALIFLSLMAHYTLPLPQAFDGIPVTGQSFAVILIAFLLGTVDSAIVLVLYLLLGGMGLPIFADGAAGLEAFTGSSAGFLYGFLISVILTNVLLTNQTKDISQIFQFMLLGTVIILVCGALHLRLFISWEDVWEYGLEPFMPGALIKLCLATCVGYGIRNFLFQEADKAVSDSYKVVTDEEE